MQETNTSAQNQNQRTITRAETPFYCHTATSCHTQQFDHCRDTWEETQEC